MRRLLALLLLLLPLALPARAEIAPQALREALAAAETLGRLAPEGSPAEALPRLADPVAGPALRALFNAPAILAARPLGPEQPAALLAWADTARRIADRYLAVARAPAPPAVGLGLQDELGLALGFLFRLQVTLFQGADAFAAGLPPGSAEAAARREAAGRLALGAAQTALGLLGMIADPGFRPANARPLAASLAADLPLLRPALSEEGRGLLLRRINAVGGRVSDAETRKALGAARSGMR